MKISGFKLQEKYLRNKSLNEIESLLGYHYGRLKQGATIYALTEIPKADQFDLRGFTQVADHQWDIKYPNGTNLDEKKLKDFLIKNVFTNIGLDRLIKVRPITAHNFDMSDDDQYPPGLGIPQWKLTDPLNARQVAEVKGDDRYFPLS